MTPEQVLCFAIEYIEEHGWTKGAYKNREGKVCAVGAIKEVADYSKPLRNAAEALLLKTIRDDSKKRLIFYGSIEDWNDQPSRTKAQVISKMKKAGNCG